jgi:hypothetical protein
MKYPSVVSVLNLWVEAFEFDAGIQSGELPVHPFWGRVSPLFPLLGFLCERLQVWDPPIQALHRQDTKGSSINNSYNFVKCPIMLLWKRQSWKRSFEKNLLPWRQ